MFFKLTVLKDFAIFTGKHLCWNLFLIKLQAWTSSLQNTSGGCFCLKLKFLVYFLSFLSLNYFNKKKPFKRTWEIYFCGLTMKVKTKSVYLFWYSYLIYYQLDKYFNRFLPYVTFLYPLLTSDNQRISDVF